MTPALATSAFESLRLDAVPDQEALRRAYELPSDAAVRKQMTELTEQTRRLIGCSSLVLVASVDVAEIYDAPAQVTRGTWHLSTDSEPDFVVAPLEIRSIFPQELPLLVSRGGLRLVERYGDWSGRPFAADAAFQLCVCEAQAG